MPKLKSRQSFVKLEEPRISRRGPKSALAPVKADVIALVLNHYTAAQIHEWLNKYRRLTVSRRVVQKAEKRIRDALGNLETGPRDPAEAALIAAINKVIAKLAEAGENGTALVQAYSAARVVRKEAVKRTAPIEAAHPEKPAASEEAAPVAAAKASASPSEAMAAEREPSPAPVGRPYVLTRKAAQQRADEKIRSGRSPALLSGDQVEALLARVENEQTKDNKE